LFEALEDVLNDAVERVFELIGLPEERVGQQLAPLLVELEEHDVERALVGLRPVDAGVRQELAGPLVAEDDLVTGLRLTVREDLLEEELSEARIGGRRNRGRGGVVVAEDIVCAERSGRSRLRRLLRLGRDTIENAANELFLLH